MKTTYTTTDIKTLARKAADYITYKCMGEANSFEVEYNGYVAFVSYAPEYRDAIGGSYEGIEFEHIAQLVSEEVKVEGVYSDNGDTEYPELAGKLEKMLN